MTRLPVPRALPLVLPLVLGLAGCGPTTGSGSSGAAPSAPLSASAPGSAGTSPGGAAPGSPAPSGSPAASGTAPSAPSPPAAVPTRTFPAPADLAVEVRADATARPVQARLRCDPPRGTHPAPARACRALAGLATPLTPAPTDRACTEQYGGPQTARIRGTHLGRPVDVRLDRADGCGIARWDALADLLAPLERRAGR